MAKPKTTWMVLDFYAGLGWRLDADFVTDGPSTGSRAGGRIVPQAPEFRCAINYPEPAATAAPPVPVTGGLS
jgi:hypothetical protein